MSWEDVTTPLVACIFLVLAPGFIVAVGARQRGVHALGLAAPLSIGVLSIASIAAPVMGLSWSYGVVFGVSFLLALLFGVFTTFWPSIGKWFYGGTAQMRRRADNVAPQKWWSSGDQWWYISAAIGIWLVMATMMSAIRNPEWIGQSFDEIFHLNLVRYFVDTGNASPLGATEVTSGGEPGSFYPAVWHALAALVYQATDNTTIPIAVNVTAVVVGSVVWPLSMMYLAYTTVSLNRLAILTVGIFSASLSAFPLLLVHWGILYPNSLGISLIPVGIALTAQVFRVSYKFYVNISQGLALGALVVLGMAVAHPSAMMSMLVMVAPIVVARMALQVKTTIEGSLSPMMGGLQVTGLVGLLLVTWILWGVIRPAPYLDWPPTASSAQAVGEFLTNGVMGMNAYWLTSAFMLLGVFFVARSRNRALWIVGSWLVVAYFYVVGRYLPYEEGRNAITGVWYNDVYRIAALTPIMASLLAALGIHYVSDYMVKKINGISVKMSTPSRSIKQVGGLFLTVLVVFQLGYGTQTAKPYTDYVETVAKYYDPSLNPWRISPDELQVLDYVEENVPSDNTIVVDPGTGGAYAYAIANRKVTAAHIFRNESDNQHLLNLYFDDVADHPEVCEAVREENAYYALDFGEVASDSQITGIDNLSNQPGYTEVYRVGDAALYRIDICD